MLQNKNAFDLAVDKEKGQVVMELIAAKADANAEYEVLLGAIWMYIFPSGPHI